MIDTRLMKEENKKQIYNEATIMKKLIHPNVISFKDVFKDTKLDYFYIVMEYADDGDLNKKIRQQQQKISKEKYFKEEKILKYFYQICKGIEYIHSKNVIHRDIKSQNIFLTKNGTIKIGDFGIAKTLAHTNSNAMTVIGTPYYFSPEIINGEPYNYKTDIWSLGVVLYEMCCLKLPFDSNNIAQLSMKILRGNYDPIPFKFSKEMHSIVKRMLNVDQNKRPDIKEVMQCPLLKNMNLNIGVNKKNNVNKKQKTWSNNNQKSVNINSTASNLNIKMNDPFLDQKKNGRKSVINKKPNKEKSVSPNKFKNKSFMIKHGIMKKNNENSDSFIELPKKSDKVKTRKSNIFKRNISQKKIEARINAKIEIEDNSIINKEKDIKKQNQNIKNINNINKSINKNNNIVNDSNRINKNNINNINIINNLQSNNNNIINTDINISKDNNIINTDTNTSKNIISSNNIIKDNINKNNNIINQKPVINFNQNLFYNGNSKNKDEIIIRSNAFDANFSGKSILFDKEKTIKLLNDEEKNNNIIESFNDINNDLNNINDHSIHFNNIYNFNEQSIQMFTLKEEDEEKEKEKEREIETKKSNNNLYNGDIDNLNFIIQNNTIKNNNTQNDQVNYLTKENDENILKVDLDFEIINNSMIKENEEVKDKKENKEKKFDLEEYIKNQIGEKMFFIIRDYLIEMNIENIVNYSFDKMINKLNEILKKKKFREREIKRAEKYIFDIFYLIINSNNNNN